MEPEALKDTGLALSHGACAEGCDLSNPKMVLTCQMTWCQEDMEWRRLEVEVGRRSREEEGAPGWSS